MKAFTALLALAGTAGIGYLVYKKMNEKKEDVEAYTEYSEKELPNKNGGKVHRASMYAVGTIKTTADKISEGIKQVKSEDMVKKGEETVKKIKTNTSTIKEHVKESAENVKESLKGNKGNIKDNVKDAADSIKGELKDAAGNIKGEISEIKDLVASINNTNNDESSDIDNDDVDFENLTSEGIPEADDIDLDSGNPMFEEIEIVDQL